MQKINDELLDKFLKGLCTKEESAAVMEYLEQNPDEENLLEEFTQADADAPLPPGYKDEMLGFILAETRPETPIVEFEEYPFPDHSRTRRLRRWSAAVAAMLILTFAAIYLMHVNKKKDNTTSGSQIASIIWIDKYNDGKKDMTMELPDGSKLSLTPGTRIRYRKDFMNFDKRLVDLVGKARFEVRKNEKIPFMVTSQGLNTCVLGTTFEVTALPSSDRIKVRLIEGKVRLDLETLVAGNERKEYYLEPGQELVFNRVSHNVAINLFTKQRKDIEADEPHYAVSRPDSVSNWYMFNNQSLADVLEQLSMIYNVRIQYSRRELSRLYFIGKLEKKDSLHKIIQDIAILNHLKVTDQNGSYIITKNKP